MPRRINKFKNSLESQIFFTESYINYHIELKASYNPQIQIFFRFELKKKERKKKTILSSSISTKR